MLTLEQVRRLRDLPLAGRNKLGAARQLAGITQVQLAEGTGHTQSYVSTIENGRYGDEGLPVETCRRFAEFLGCSIEDLFPAARDAESRQAVNS